MVLSFTSDMTSKKQKVPFPEQPENPPPQTFKPTSWKGDSAMPPVILANIRQWGVAFVFDDNTGASFINQSDTSSELMLVSLQDRKSVGTLQVSFPEPDVLTMEGSFYDQKVRMTFRRIPAAEKQYVFRSRGFHWVQEYPFNP